MDNQKEGMFLFDGVVGAIDSMTCQSKKWRMLKAIFDYTTKGVLPSEEIRNNGIFLMVKAVTDAGNKKSEKEDERNEKEDKSNTKADSKMLFSSIEKVAKVSSKSRSKKVETAGIKNINKNKKEIEKEIYKEKDKEKSSSSSSCVRARGKSESGKVEEEEDWKEIFFNSESLSSPPEFIESIEECGKNIEDAYLIGCFSRNKPTLEQVRAFVDNAGLVVQPETFYSYYEAKDWMVKGEKMADWRACILKWNKHQLQSIAEVEAKTKQEATKIKELEEKPRLVNYRGEKYTIEEFNKMFFDDLNGEFDL